MTNFGKNFVLKDFLPFRNSGHDIVRFPDVLGNPVEVHLLGTDWQCLVQIRDQCQLEEMRR